MKRQRKIYICYEEFYNRNGEAFSSPIFCADTAKNAWKLILKHIERKWMAEDDQFIYTDTGNWDRPGQITVEILGVKHNFFVEPNILYES